MKQERIVYLIQKHLRGDLTPEEKTVLFEWTQRDKHNRSLLDSMTDASWLQSQLEAYDALASQDLEGESKRLARQIMGQRGLFSRVRWFAYAAAAMIVLALGISLWFLRDPETIHPGGNRAVL